MNDWKPIESAPKDGTDVLLFTRRGICQGWFEQGKWTNDTPVSPAEYFGDAWVCCDDAFQIEVEFGPDGFECHGEATHWMPLPEPPEESRND